MIVYNCILCFEMHKGQEKKIHSKTMHKKIIVLTETDILWCLRISTTVCILTLKYDKQQSIQSSEITQQKHN